MKEEEEDAHKGELEGLLERTVSTWTVRASALPLQWRRSTG